MIATSEPTLAAEARILYREAKELHLIFCSIYGYENCVRLLLKHGATVNALSSDGGNALMGAIKTIERKLVDGTFRHGGQALMKWCAGNAIVQPTPTGMRVARDASGYGKIDPLMALFDATALMAMNPSAPGQGLSDFLSRPVIA